ncbi:MAG TPA: universal stress protein [Magnetospirillaceae bacterium]|nr:universal stress protein [Magnetospirillaceae bacterium]
MKDILVQLDGGEVSPRRLDAAIELAQRFGARVTGLFAQKESDAAALVARRPGTRLAEAAADSRLKFEAAIAAAKLTGRWLALAHGDPGFVTTEVAFCARYFDLAVIGQGSGDYPQLPDDMVERAILESGRPVLVIPRSGKIDPIGKRIAVAWNASREASRALHDALPLMAGAEAVTLLSVPRGAAPMPGDLPEMDVIGHLAGHGVLARFERIRAEDIGVMDLLLSRAFDLGADLLVMGAPAGSSFGKSSGTRFLLKHLTLPVIISG